MTGFVIRPALLEDSAALAGLRWRFKNEDGPADVADERGFRARCEDWIRSRLADRWQAWVAEISGGGICGQVFLNRVEKVPKPGDAAEEFGYITNFYVMPAWRGRGVGRALLEEVGRYGWENHLDTLIVWPSDDGASLYRRIGFRPPDELLELPIESD